MNSELIAQNKEILSLRRHKNIADDRLRIEVQRRTEAEDGEEEEIRQNNRLVKQIKQMELFLKEYGMVWVGDDPTKKKLKAEQVSRICI